MHSFSTGMVRVDVQHLRDATAAPAGKAAIDEVAPVCALSIPAFDSLAGMILQLTGKEEALLVATACAKPPAGHKRWTLTLLADYFNKPDRLISSGRITQIKKGKYGASVEEAQPRNG